MTFGKQLGMGASSMLLPQNMLAVRFDDGTTGFLDPADGTYYDNQGNDITGFVNLYGGATVVGQASPASIAAAEGIPAPTVPTTAPVLPPGPAPRISTVPTSTSSVNSALNWFTGATLVSGIPNFAVIGGGFLLVSLIGGMAGGRRRR